MAQGIQGLNNFAGKRSDKRIANKSMENNLKLIIITPVRNEEQFIEVTIKCMIKQTIKPLLWIIVNDGSTDKTDAIVRNFINIPYIKYLPLKDRGYRLPGKGVVEAFYEGYEIAKLIDFDIISKFDGDLDFPENTIEVILDAFDSNPKLGIAGGTRYERRGNSLEFKKLLVSKGFVGGPFKFYRKKCFEDIKGLIKRAGWDGVDTVKANMMGWETGEIASLKIIHLKSTGSAIGEGLKKANTKYGDVSYYMGGYFWYFLLRAFLRSIECRSHKIAFFMVKGYFDSLKRGLPRESEQFRAALKKIQIKQLKYWLNSILCM